MFSKNVYDLFNFNLMLFPKPQTILNRVLPNSKEYIFPLKTIQLLSEEYGFNIYKCKQIRKQNQVHETNPFLVESDKGKMILREHIRNSNIDRLLFEHSLIEFLYRNNVRVAKPLKTCNGKTFLEIDGKYYVFFDYIPGYQYQDYFFKRKDKVKHIMQAAETLGRFHKLVVGFIPKGRKSWHDFRETKQSLDIYYNLVRKKSSKDNFDNFILNNICFLKDKLLELGEYFKPLKHIPRCIIHEDYGPYNLIFRDGKLLCILDLMDAHLDWVAKDVIFSLWIFTNTRKTFYDEELIEVFLYSYQLSCSITAEEIDIMPDLFCFKRLNELIPYLAAHYSESEHASYYSVMLTKFIREINWHQQNKKQLSKQLKKYIKKSSIGIASAV